MSTRCLSSRVVKHLGTYLKTESSVKDRILSYDFDADSKFNVNSFKIIKKCNSNFKAKIHEALFIEKYTVTSDLIDNYLGMDHYFC